MSEGTTLSKVVISLGSNVAPKKATLQKALAEIVLRKIARVLMISPFYKTQPWGVEDQDWYLNGCCLLETHMNPLELLDALQKIETDYGRVRDIRWGPRTLDLDILFFENFDEYKDERLTIPHPYLTKRAFVLKPLIDLMPWGAVEGKSFIDYLKDLNDNSLIKLVPIEDDFEETLKLYWDDLCPTKITPGLNRVEAALEALGSPHKNLPSVIHIAGTNGKGSTAAILMAVLRKAGKKVHRYTSPHLRRYNERYVIGMENGQSRFVQKNEFEVYASKLVPIIDKFKLSHFEALTILAFLLFSQNSADYVILETGMGGRLDATNVIAKPAMTIITSISMDHTEFLGDSIEAIAFEKAGIIKKNVPLVVSTRNQDAAKVVCDMAEQLKAPVYKLGEAWDIKLVDDAEVFISTLTSREVFLDILNLNGVHQLDNAGAALMAAQILLGDNFLMDEELDEVLENIKWPARLEKLEQGVCKLKFPSNCEIIVDGCHNAEGMMSFTEQMLALNMMKPKKLVIFFSAKKGRNLQEVFSIFSRLNAHFIFIEDSGAREQYTAKELAEAAAYQDISFEVSKNWLVMNNYVNNNDLDSIRFAVCGSLYFCGAFYNLIEYKMIP